MAGRNAALAWLREEVEDVEGVVYFADDDNAYDPRLFRRCIAGVETVSAWPVGLAGILPSLSSLV